jgi:membrane protein DedA with SNARE-associated domain
MSGFISWLSALPLAVLYPVLTVVAAVENVFPPVPADTVVALGSWLAARGEGSALGAFLATWIGNVAGAAGMYYVGRSHGEGWIRRRFPKLADERAEKRLEAMYGKYGLAALVVSRLVPGVRAVVPPFAGALGIPAGRAIAAMAVASGVWYGIISYVAFHAGADWSKLTELVRRSGTLIALVAGGLLAIGVLVWWIMRRREVKA